MEKLLEPPGSLAESPPPKHAGDGGLDLTSLCLLRAPTSLSPAPTLLLLSLLWHLLFRESLMHWAIHLAVSCPALQPMSWVCLSPAGGFELVDLVLVHASASSSVKWE